MRTLFTGITVAVMTILLAPTAALGHLFGSHDLERRLSIWCMRTWARSICWAAGIKLVVHGAENVVPERGTVYAINHVSWFDIFAIASLLPKYTFVAKAELRRIPIFGWGAEACGVVFLERENRASAFEAYRHVAKKVAEGLSVVVCPEGTREVMRKGAWQVQSGVVHVHFLTPLETTGTDYDHRHELMRAAWTQISDTLRDVYGVGSGRSGAVSSEVEGAA